VLAVATVACSRMSERHRDSFRTLLFALLVDLSPHREVVVFPSGSLLAKPMATEGRSPINREGIVELIELFTLQDERMGAECQDLVGPLEELEGWGPGDEVRLRLDDFRPLLGHVECGAI
jgi:hypothetical protein